MKDLLHKNLLEIIIYNIKFHNLTTYAFESQFVKNQKGCHFRQPFQCV